MFKTEVSKPHTLLVTMRGIATASPLPMPERMAKKARYMSAWESTLADEDSSPRLGLSQLFGSRPRSRQGNGNVTSNFLFDAPQEARQNHRRFLNEQDNGFFTLRLEHREGGANSRHRGEERILLFRSDRAGAIAKCVYSSIPAPALPRTETPNSDKESDLRLMTQAKIHVLDVKEPYRGYDFGGLLFSEAISSLRHQYMDYEDGHHIPYSYFIRCQLDAEEDICRHNKLVRFYENLGCSVKPKARVQYLNSNDGETYRKVPMQMALRGSSDTSWHQATDRSLVDRRRVFLPVQLLDISGASIHVSRLDGKEGCRLDWLMVDDGEGNIQFHTTHGHYLRAQPDGRCFAVVVSDEAQDGDTPPECWANLRLYRVSDSDEFASSDEESESGARQKELWMLKTVHGTFLSVLSDEHSMYCSKTPEFWQADDNTLSLICTNDTPPRRQHYRKTWAKQTMDYVQGMHERYLTFQLREMSIRNALDLVKARPYHHFQVTRNRSDPGPSLRTFCINLAEASRIAGHPDWVQFVALVHELGAVVNFIDMQTAADSENDYDWTISCRSRIVGAAAPTRASFAEFRSLNSDEKDERYNTAHGIYSPHVGLEKVMMAWTGPEYMYHMLKHNNALIPKEGLSMLRYFSLGDWHTHSEYLQLTNEDDADVRAFVFEFDQLRRDERRRCKDVKDLSDEECNRLWEAYYGSIVAKYCGEGKLMW